MQQDGSSPIDGAERARTGSRGARSRTAPSTPRRRFTPEERRAAVEAFRSSGRTRGDFAQLWGFSPSSLDVWCRSYDRDGPKGLEPKPRGPRTRAKPHPARLPESVRDEVVKVRQEQPHFGLRRIRDFLRRFRGVAAGVAADPGPTWWWNRCSRASRVSASRWMC